MVGPWQDAARPVYLPDPIHRGHPLHRGRAAWWLALPGIDGGRQLFDLVGLSHGTLTNGPAWRSAIPRPGGWAAISLDGTDDCIDLGTPAPLNFTAEFTLAAWIYPRTFGGSSRGRILAREGTADGYFLTVNNLNVANGLSVSTAGTNGTPVTSSNGVLATNAWQHVVATFTASTIAFYINGVSAGGGANANGAVASNSNTTRIGGRAADNGRNFDGLIDDVQAWSRALSAADVRALYDLSRQGYPGVLNRWRPRVATLALSSSASGSAALAGLATLSASGVATASGSAPPAALATLSASGTAAASGSAAPASTATLSASGTAAASGSAPIVAIASLASSGQARGLGSATLVASASLSASGAASASGSAALAALATLILDATPTRKPRSIACTAARRGRPDKPALDPTLTRASRR